MMNESLHSYLGSGQSLKLQLHFCQLSCAIINLGPFNTKVGALKLVSHILNNRKYRFHNLRPQYQLGITHFIQRKKRKETTIITSIFI